MICREFVLRLLGKHQPCVPIFEKLLRLLDVLDVSEPARFARLINLHLTGRTIEQCDMKCIHL